MTAAKSKAMKWFNATSPMTPINQLKPFVSSIALNMAIAGPVASYGLASNTLIFPGTAYVNSATINSMTTKNGQLMTMNLTG